MDIESEEVGGAVWIVFPRETYYLILTRILRYESESSEFAIHRGSHNELIRSQRYSWFEGMFGDLFDAFYCLIDGELPRSVDSSHDERPSHITRVSHILGSCIDEDEISLLDLSHVSRIVEDTCICP